MKAISLAAIVLLAAIHDPAHAGSQADQRRGTLRTSAPVIDVFELAPDPATDVQLADAKLTFHSDLTRILTLTYHTKSVRKTGFLFFVGVDPMQRTYRVFRIQGDARADVRVRQYLEGMRPRLEREGQWQRYRDHGKRDSHVTTLSDIMGTWDGEEPPPNCKQCQNTCYGAGSSRAITWDPAYIQLTHSDIDINWAREDTPTGCRWTARGRGQCWAANPSELGTHWFVSSCQRSPVISAEMYARGETFGQFFNDDFGDDDERTWVNNRAIVEFTGSAVVHVFQFASWGEWSWFLDATVAGSSHNTCW